MSDMERQVKGERGKGNTCTKRHIPVLFALKLVDSIDFATDKLMWHKICCNNYLCWKFNSKSLPKQDIEVSFP